MKESAKLVIALAAICLAAGALLGWVNSLTAGPIEETERRVKMAAIRKVLPPCSNSPDADTLVVEEDGKKWTFHVARSENGFAGAAFETASAAGYGGGISVMVGVNAEGAVHAVEILRHKETPGLGAKIIEPAFTGQFAGKDTRETTWAVKKDGGEIDAVTAATISSRAVVEAVKAGLDAYIKHEAQIAEVGTDGG
ncbi:RnfABCDGE type electron transport complex subunit G [Verrucomicrobiota bacterium]